jgi:hypothetical protein
VSAIISYDLAVQIAYAHREVQTGEKLIADMREGILAAKSIDYRDTFGQRANIQLKVPHSSSTSGSLTAQLFDIKPELALAVIEAHVAECRGRLSVLSQRAKAELESEVAA